MPTHFTADMASETADRDELTGLPPKVDLATLDKTFRADHVYVKLAVAPLAIVKRFDIPPPPIETFPVVATRVDMHANCPTATQDYCSTWFVSRRGSRGIRSLKYVYEFDTSESSTLTLEIGGGSMIGSRLVSKPQSLLYNSSNRSQPVVG